MLVNAAEQWDSTSRLQDAEDSAIEETLRINLMPMVFMTRFLGPTL